MNDGTVWRVWLCEGLGCCHEIEAPQEFMPQCTWCGSIRGRLLSTRTGYYGKPE